MTLENSNVGTLADYEIIAMCENGQLIIENFAPANIKQACYELRSSDIYYDLADNNKKFELINDEYILLKPKQLVVIITMESLRLPHNMLGRILTKGKLFTIGLLPVNTYADPGFEGRLGIVFYNLSNNYIKIKPGEPIAKIEFSKLQNSVHHAYHGQHGYSAQMWPVPNDMIIDDAVVMTDPRVKDELTEVERTHGKTISTVLHRVYGFERYLIFAGIAYLFFSTILISALIYKGATVEAIVSPVAGVALGVASNILTTLLIHFATNLRR